MQAWCRSSLWLTRRVAGIGVEFRGLERIPPGGLLVASKHQSFLETFALIAVLDDPAFILKRELMWIPFVGWFLAKIGMVPIDRGARSLALVEMNRRARAEAAKGRQILIFPEGTRRPPGAEPAYKYGVAHLYRSLGVPCVPVALNAGLFWPRRSFVRRPGTAVIEFGEPIPPGLDRDAAFAEIRSPHRDGVPPSSRRGRDGWRRAFSGLRRRGERGAADRLLSRQVRAKGDRSRRERFTGSDLAPRTA